MSPLTVLEAPVVMYVFASTAKLAALPRFTLAGLAAWLGAADIPTAIKMAMEKAEMLVRNLDCVFILNWRYLKS
jgi:hypothetical protein